MKMIGSFAVVMALSLLCCASAGESPRMEKFLGAKALRVLATPDRVEVFRVAPSWEKAKSKETFAGCPLLATHKEQGKEFATQLAAALHDDSNYEWDIKKACEFAPGVGYRIWSGKESIVVLLCFSCNEIAVISDETKTKEKSWNEIDPGRGKFVRLAKQAFADDKSIQDLSE